MRRVLNTKEYLIKVMLRRKIAFEKTPLFKNFVKDVSKDNLFTHLGHHNHSGRRFSSKIQTEGVIFFCFRYLELERKLDSFRC